MLVRSELDRDASWIVESGTGLLLVGRELADHSTELLDRREMDRVAGQERAS